MSKFITILGFTLYIITFSKMRKEVTVEIGPTSTVSNEHDSKSRTVLSRYFQRIFVSRPFLGAYYVRQGARIFGCVAGFWALFGGFSLMVVPVWNYILGGVLRR